MEGHQPGLDGGLCLVGPSLSHRDLLLMADLDDLLLPWPVDLALTPQRPTDLLGPSPRVRRRLWRRS